MEQLNSCSPITLACDDCVNNITFDGCSYYCTIRCKAEIQKLNCCKQVQQQYCTCREYDCICYDWREHCFWACAKSCCNTIFKLDCAMREIDSIQIRGVGICEGITGISFKCCSNSLLVSFACAIVEVQKDTETAQVVYTAKDDWILGVLSLCPGTFAIVLRKGKYYVEGFDACFEKVSCHPAGEHCTVKNLIFNPCASKTDSPQMEVFCLKKHRYPYLCSYPVRLHCLKWVPCRCNYEICDACCCRKDHCRPEDACAQVLESIALMEAALSHILNAEGEKLQKALAESDDMEEILCVNREVNQTIVNATHLEQVLYAKLNALTSMGCCPPCACEEPLDK